MSGHWMRGYVLPPRPGYDASDAAEDAREAAAEEAQRLARRLSADEGEQLARTFDQCEVAATDDRGRPLTLPERLDVLLARQDAETAALETRLAELRAALRLAHDNKRNVA